MLVVPSCVAVLSWFPSLLPPKCHFTNERAEEVAVITHRGALFGRDKPFTLTRQPRDFDEANYHIRSSWHHFFPLIFMSVRSVNQPIIPFFRLLTPKRNFPLRFRLIWGKYRFCRRGISQAPISGTMSIPMAAPASKASPLPTLVRVVS